SRGRAELVEVVVPVLAVGSDACLLGQDALRTDEDELELTARAAAEVGVVLVRVDHRRRLGLALAHADVVVDERRVALRIARRARHLRPLVGAGEAVLLAVEGLALVAGGGPPPVDPGAGGVGAWWVGAGGWG